MVTHLGNENGTYSYFEFRSANTLSLLLVTNYLLHHIPWTPRRCLFP